MRFQATPEGSESPQVQGRLNEEHTRSKIGSAAAAQGVAPRRHAGGFVRSDSGLAPRDRLVRTQVTSQVRQIRLALAGLRRRIANAGIGRKRRHRAQELRRSPRFQLLLEIVGEPEQFGLGKKGRIRFASATTSSTLPFRSTSNGRASSRSRLGVRK
jgi:hypothetical protein